MTVKDEIRAAAEADLETFIRLVHPKRALGSIHTDVLSWMSRQDAKSHQLLLLPRDHGKSAMAAYRAAWEITRNPAVRILYISSTSTLAVKQLKFIKDILTSSIYRRYWPEMVTQEEAKREKWTETEISIDHPIRREENIRDATIFTAGLTTNVTGLHADWIFLDDIVVNENAYTEEGRARVETQFSLLASVAGTDARMLVVGTRYHPKDLYAIMVGLKWDVVNDDGEITETKELYETREHAVEDRGDGTGEFLWPRQQNKDGKWFGFNSEILARKKVQYLDQVQFRAQYYNDPNDPENAGIKREMFQYYDKSFLSRQNGQWFYKGYRLNVFAAIDFAYTLNKRSDFTSICVVGVDANQNYYVLDVDRFKTDDVLEYFQHILRLHQKWDFRQLVAEVTAAQEVIVKNLKNEHIRKHGLALTIKDFRPNRMAGSKQERIAAILKPRYDNRQVWHYQGGHCQTLEEELLLDNPPHDDVKDALASCIDQCLAPSFRRVVNPLSVLKPMFHNRFGGIA